MQILKWLGRAMAVLGLSMTAVTVTPLVGWWARTLAGEWHDPRGGVLVVLGGSVHGDGMIGGSSYWRAVYAARAWREGGFGEVIVTGGGEGAVSVAESMRDFLACSGVPRERIRVETASRSTRENAIHTRPMVEGRPIVLLTSDYHMYRAHRVFLQAGFQVAPRPFPDALKSYPCYRCRWSVFLELARETVKIGYYRARGWI